MTEESKKNIKDGVLSAIKQGQVTMKPKWQFVAQAVLLVVGVVFFVLALLYLTSFIFFMLHQTGLWFAPGFGYRGVRELFFGFPWVLVLLSVSLAAVLEILVRKYPFGYGRPIIYSVFAIVSVVILGGFLISLTPVHRNLFDHAQRDELLFGTGFYLQYGIPPQKGSVTPGEIIEAMENGFEISTPREEILTVIVTPETRLPFGNDFIKGDKIIVVGDREGLVIKAYGIREVSDDVILPPKKTKPRR